MPPPAFATSPKTRTTASGAVAIPSSSTTISGSGSSAWPHGAGPSPEWPVEYGGGGLSQDEAKVLEQEMRRIGARRPLDSLGIWMLGPALLKFGTEEQKRTYLPPIARGEIRWAQGYSEPGAGSDLASIATRGEDMGDHFLVNGSKIWTTYGHKCDMIFTLVRTEPDAPSIWASASC
ncbi:acyl-CoA dehydrogenase family protein [Sphingomonas sp. MMS24-JH45]